MGRILLDAGSPADWAEGGEPSEGILEIIDAWRTAALGETAVT